MIALGVVFSSYASEVFLSAFRAIPHGQYEGGYAIGLTNGQTMRLVVLPQLIRIALPGLGQSLADPAQGHRAGLGDRPRRHTAPERHRGARHQARVPVLRHRQPHLSCRWPSSRRSASTPSSARSASQEAASMSAVAADRSTSIGRRRSRAAGRASASSAMLLVGLVDRRRHRPRRLPGARPGTRNSSPNMRRPICPASASPCRWSSSRSSSARSCRCRSPMPACRGIWSCPALAYGYVYFFRGTPLLAQTFLVYYGLGLVPAAARGDRPLGVLPRGLVLRALRLLAEHCRLSGRDPARRDRERAARANGKVPPRSACTNCRRCGRSSCRRR